MTPAGANSSMRVGRFLLGFFLIWGVLYASGAAQRGGVAYGLLALGLTAAVAALWERFAFGTPVRSLLGSLGFGRPTGRSLLAGAVISSGVLAFYPLYVLASGNDLPLRVDWLWLAIGLFAYHGLAEELAWRGYAFRRLRQGHSFGAAIRWTMPLIAITHLPIVLTNGLAVGIFAVVVAIVTCLPFGYLWERGGQTIWAAAMLHAAIDAFKLFEVPAGQAGVVFSLTLAIVSLVVPLSVFAFGDRFFGRRWTSTDAGHASWRRSPRRFSGAAAAP
jgi:membrane protease YdiL (CAAX protease family)